MNIRLFYSYTHIDAKHQDSLEKHLTLLRDEGKISDWSDKEIQAGEEWDPVIEKKMKEAHIILLLLSPDFLASNNCKKEMNIALNLKDKKNTIVIPVILRDCA